MYIHRPAAGEVWLNNLDNTNFALRAKKIVSCIIEMIGRKESALSASENAKRALARFFR
jgi:hypothetical protein